MIKENIYNEDECRDLCHGIFNTRNTVGDEMEILDTIDGVRIEICDSWGYFEVFGLTEEEWKELRAFYWDLALEIRAR